MLDRSQLSIINNPNIYSDIKAQKFHPDGIQSETIFGPVNSYKCQCGEYSIRTFHEGKRCPTCKVLCESNELRYSSFAKIQLNTPVINPFLIYKFKRVCKQNPNLIDPLQSDLVSSMDSYLEFNKNKLQIVLSYNSYCSPIRITGIHSLYLSLCDLYFKTCDAKIKSLIDCYIDEVVVSPPQTRVNFVLEKKEIENQLNKDYINLIKVNNYFKDNTNYSLNELVDTEEIYSFDFSNADIMVSKIQFYTNCIYNNIIKLLSNKTGMIRGSFLSRTIDFSSRSVLISNPTLRSYEIKVSKLTFIKLWMIEFLRFLIIQKKYSKNQWVDIIKNTESIFTEYIDYIDEFIEYYFDIKNVDYLNRLVLINRQPTLFKYGITCVEVVGITEGNMTEISPFIMQQMNADCDGDTLAIYRIHDYKSLQELEQNSFNLNNVKYDHTDDLIHTIRLDSIYGFNLLTKMEIDNNKIKLHIVNLKDLNDYYTNLDQPIIFNGKIYTYGIGLINKWCDFNTIKIDKNISENNISKVLLNSSNSLVEYHNKLRDLNKKLLWFVSTHPTEILTIPFELELFEESQEKNILQNLPNNPIFGYYIHQAMISRFIKKFETNKQSKICKLLGTKLNSIQLSRAVLAIGYIADNFNIIRNNPIKSNLFTGLTEEDFFNTCYGTRKGITDKSSITPKSGYMERSMVMNLSPVELDMDDCGSNNYFPITIQDEKHINTLQHRWYLDEESESIKLFTTGEIGKIYYFRSPITCKNPDFKICHKCFGNYNLVSKYAGILAGQYISERFTQLSMRSFHTSGSCSLEMNKDVLNYFIDNLEDIDVINDNHNIYYNLIVRKIDNDILEIISQFKGFHQASKNTITITDINEYIENPDVGFLMKQLRKNLSKEGGFDIVETYNELIGIILKTSDLFSCFLEIVLCNMFISNNGEILRYEQNDDYTIKKRLSYKKLYTIYSPVLGLLYEPNAKSILSLKDIKQLQNFKPQSIYEKLWYGYI